LRALKKESADPSIQKLKDANYVIGYNEGLLLKDSHYILNYSQFSQGIKDGFYSSAKKNLLDKKESIIKTYITTLIQQKKPSNIGSFSYIIGIDYGKDFFMKFFPLKLSSFVKGVKEALEGKKSPFNKNETALINIFYDKAEELRKKNNNNSTLFVSSQKDFYKLNDSISYKTVKDGKGSLLSDLTPNDSLKIIFLIKDENASVINRSEDQKDGDLFFYKNLTPYMKQALSVMKEGGQKIFYIPIKLLYQPKLKKTVSDSKNLAILDITVVKVNKEKRSDSKEKKISQRDVHGEKNKKS
jgi:hypothetical protein